MQQVARSPGDALEARARGVMSRIENCARKAGRLPEEVTLIAASKTQPAIAVRRAIEAGIREFGENRVQEAERKISEVGKELARWHLIGHLQGNKARRAVRNFDLVHSLDSPELAARLEQLCVEEDRALLPMLIQVDLAGEATKSGVAEQDLKTVVSALGRCERLQLIGLMTIPPLFSEPEMVRPYFQRLRLLRDELRKQGAFGAGAGELSMGMSNDYEVAIQEGATMVRVGTAIFGSRPDA